MRAVIDNRQSAAVGGAGYREGPARHAALAATLAALSVGFAGCEKSTAPNAGETLDNRAPPGAARPMPAPARSHFRVECFDVYAGCPAVTGLPAVSADGMRVAVAETGDENARDEFVLFVVYLAGDTGAELSRTPILTPEDRARGVDPDTEELSPALRATVEQRIRGADSELARGGFAPLQYLGVVDEERPGEPVAGVRARFDGARVIVTESQGDGRSEAVRWSEPVRPTLERAGEAGCSSAQVAEIRVWVRRSPKVLLARVGYTTAHMCDVSSQYQAWR